MLTSQETTPLSTDSEPLRPTFIPATWPKIFTNNQQPVPDILQNIMANNVTIPIKTMPGRNHHSAPKFDSKSASLSIFLDEVEQLAKICRLTSKQRIHWTAHYAPSEEHELCKMQDAVGMED